MVYSSKGRSDRCGPQMGNMEKHQCTSFGPAGHLPLRGRLRGYHFRGVLIG